MRGITENFKDLSDSRELMEARPHPFGIYFIYILLGILVISLLWATIGEVDVVVKSRGVIRPEGGTSTLTAATSGKLITALKQNGDLVKSGDILFEIESSGVQKQLLSVEEGLRVAEEDLKRLETLKASIEDGINHFDQAKDSEGFQLYVQYAMDKVKTTETILSLESQRNSLESDIIGFGAILRAIENNQKTCAGGKTYQRWLDDYTYKMSDLMEKAVTAKDKFEQAKALFDEGALSASEYKTLEQAYTASVSGAFAYQNETLLSYQEKVDQSKEQLSTLKAQLMQLKPESALDSPQAYFESAKLLTLTEEIKALVLKKDQLSVNQKQLSLELEKCSITSPMDGVLAMDRLYVVGDVIDSGMKFGTVVPGVAQDLKVQLYLPNASISQVAVGDGVKLKVDALPYKEYGLLRGKITHINADASVDSTSGMSYYLVDVKLEANHLRSYKGKDEQVIPGMTLDGQIVAERKKIIRLMLEKLDFWS
jgi:HlyD family secretion protein